MDLLLSGEKLPGDIDDLVDARHDTPDESAVASLSLAEYLGMAAARSAIPGDPVSRLGVFTQGLVVAGWDSQGGGRGAGGLASRCGGGWRQRGRRFGKRAR